MPTARAHVDAMKAPEAVDDLAVHYLHAMPRRRTKSPGRYRLTATADASTAGGVISGAPQGIFDALSRLKSPRDAFSINVGRDAQQLCRRRATSPSFITVEMVRALIIFHTMPLIYAPLFDHG